MENLKILVLNSCKQSLQATIDHFSNLLADLKEIGANETKRTAGDKHETSLAMIQIEQENNLKHLRDAQEKMNIINKIDPAIRPQEIVLGCLVKTNRGYFFLASSLGKIKVENETVMVLSLQSPLGSKLLGKRTGDHVELNSNTFQIQHFE